MDETRDDRLGSATPAQQVADYLKVLRRRWKLILALTVLVTGAAVALSLTATPRYDATAKLLLRQEEPINQIVQGYGSQSNDPERDANTSVELIKLETVADRVRQRLALDTSPDSLLRQVDTKAEGNSDIVSLTVRDTSPQRAADLANAFAEEYVRFRREAARSTLEEAAALARRQLEGLDPTERATPQGRVLESRLRDLEIAAALQTGGVETVRRAGPPEEPASPRPMMNGVLGAMLGLLFAVFAAVALEFIDRRMKDEDEIQSIFGLPILATVPAAARRSRGGGPSDDQLQRESYGALAANLRFANVDRRLRSLMITSPSSGDGKTNVTLGLAAALSVLGQRVIAIEADLRRPSFPTYLGLPRGGGLSSVLSGVGTVEQELIEINADTMRPSEVEDPSATTSFAVLPAGAIPPNPRQLLSSAGMEQVIARASELADIVLLDTPPIGTVTDAMTLIEDVDATVLVAKLKWTRRDVARRALRVLRNLEVRVLGMAITNTPRSIDSYYGEEYLASPERAASRN